MRLFGLDEEEIRILGTNILLVMSGFLLLVGSLFSLVALFNIVGLGIWVLLLVSIVLGAAMSSDKISEKRRNERQAARDAERASDLRRPYTFNRS